MQVQQGELSRRDRFRLYRVLMVAGALFVITWLIWSARGSLFPFFLGLVLAYLLAPIVNRIQRVIPNRGWIGRTRRTWAVIIVYLIGLSIIAAMIATVGSVLIDETFELIENLPAYTDDAKAEADSWTEWYEETVPPELQDTIESNLDQFGSMAGEAARTALFTTFGTVARIISFVAGLALLPLWLFYVLKDDRKALDFFYRLWPASIQPDIRHIVGIADRILGAYIRGQLFLGFIVGSVTFVGLWSLDVQYSGALAVLAGIFEMVPIIGPWISFVAAAIVVLATEPEKLWMIALLFLGIQQLEALPRGSRLRLDDAPAPVEGGPSTCQSASAPMAGGGVSSQKGTVVGLASGVASPAGVAGVETGRTSGTTTGPSWRGRRTTRAISRVKTTSRPVSSVARLQRGCPAPPHGNAGHEDVLAGLGAAPWRAVGFDRSRSRRKSLSRRARKAASGCSHSRSRIWAITSSVSGSRSAASVPNSMAGALPTNAFQ